MRAETRADRVGQSWIEAAERWKTRTHLAAAPHDDIRVPDQELPKGREHAVPGLGPKGRHLDEQGEQALHDGHGFSALLCWARVPAEREGLGVRHVGLVAEVPQQVGENVEVAPKGLLLLGLLGVAR